MILFTRINTQSIGSTLVTLLTNEFKICVTKTNSTSKLIPKHEELFQDIGKNWPL